MDTPKPPALGIDLYTPAEIADRIEAAGVTKARMPLVKLAVLGLLAGAFIGLGAMYFTIVVADPGLGFAAARLLGGLVFSLGLVLVVIAGAELFTGNNLIVMAWAEGKVTTAEVLRNWAVVLAANAVGAAGLAWLVWMSGHTGMAGGRIASQTMAIAAAKTAMPFAEAFFRGVMCNILVCMAVWIAMAGRSVTDKTLAVVFPISAFVAAGFEHSIANFYFIPLAMLLATSGTAVPPGAALDLTGLASNLVPVILGNLAGGAVLVAGVYWIVWRKAA
ncbi:MAG: formate/nitrite transporter family protein [Burkholderiales bacterium]|nr:formate/nitrite transporter family protein [Burkholderiales bacterium]